VVFWVDVVKIGGEAITKVQKYKSTIVALKGYVFYTCKQGFNQIATTIVIWSVLLTLNI